MKRTLQPASPAVLALLAVLAAATLAVGGCSAEPSAVIPKSEPTFKPVFKSDAEALAAAEKDYAGYIATSDSVVNSDHPNPEDIAQWVTPLELKSLLQEYDEVTKSGDHDHGVITVPYFKLQDLLQKQSGRVILTAYVCNDVSNFNLVDRSGTVITPSDRPPIYPLQVRFKNSKPGSKTLLVDASTLWPGSSFC